MGNQPKHNPKKKKEKQDFSQPQHRMSDKGANQTKKRQQQKKNL
jgi:hypothetical protein